jgi:Ser/Thr protein kinase RdoA (MazF antagonist)
VLRRFLDGYESVRVLTGEERSALPVLAVMLYPPNPRHYRWWRDQHGQDLVQQLRDDVTVMKTLEAEVERTFPTLFAEGGRSP